jgi:hypothetical protein
VQDIIPYNLDVGVISQVAWHVELPTLADMHALLGVDPASITTLDDYLQVGRSVVDHYCCEA